VINYSYRTLHHKNINKYELTNEEFLEGCKAVEVVAEQLERDRYKPYINLLARNFFQTKFAKQLSAVGILRSDQNGVLVQLEGGTGWSVQMAINMKREIYVFDQNRCKWFAWSYTKKQFTEYENPIISQEHFAGIGTRKINIFGIQANNEL